MNKKQNVNRTDIEDSDVDQTTTPSPRTRINSTGIKVEVNAVIWFDVTVNLKRFKKNRDNATRAKILASSETLHI